MGGDPKNRHFRTVSQSLKYDPSGHYIRKWIHIGSNEVEASLRPWAYEKDWPNPIVDPETQLTFCDKERLESEGKISTIEPMMN